MSLLRALCASAFIGLALACSGAGDESSSKGITQSDIDRLLIDNKPGACLSQNLKEPIGKTADGRTFLRAGCRQAIPEGSTLQDCKDLKKRISADYRVTFYANKHCSDLKLSGKDLGGFRAISGYGEVEGGIVVDESSAASQSSAQSSQPTEPKNQPHPSEQQADGGIVVE